MALVRFHELRDDWGKQKIVELIHHYADKEHYIADKLARAEL